MIAQHGWDKVTADAYEKGENLFIQKGYNPQTNKYIISYGDRSKSKSCKRVIVNTEKEADIFIKEHINKEKEVAQQTNIDTEIEEMEVYAALHTKKVRKKHTFKKCPICGSTNIRIIDLKPLGHKNSSQCRECGHTL